MEAAAPLPSVVSAGRGAVAVAPSAAASPPDFGQLSVIATVRVAQAFDRLGDWLARLPANPVTDLVSGALLLVRRALLPEVPQIPDVTVAGALFVEGEPEVFTVELSRAYSTPVSVAYSTSDGTAVAGADFEAATGILDFAPGQTTQQIAVNVLADDIEEPRENFSLDLFPVVGGEPVTGVGLGSAEGFVAGGLLDNVSVTITNSSQKPVTVQACSGKSNSFTCSPSDVRTLLPGESITGPTNWKTKGYIGSSDLTFFANNGLFTPYFDFIKGGEVVDSAKSGTTTWYASVGWWDRFWNGLRASSWVQQAGFQQISVEIAGGGSGTDMAVTLR